MTARKSFLAGTAALAAATQFAGAQGLTKLRLSGSPDHDIIGALWGQQSGIFAKYGLDVNIQVANSGAVVTAAVIGGSLDLGKGSLLSLLGAHIRGVPILLEAPSAIWDSDAPESAFVVAKDSPIRNGHDLNGKTVSVPSLGDQYQISISSWIDTHGGDSSTVHFLELPHRAAAESIAAGRVDAANIAPPVLTDALVSGKVRILGHAQDAIARHFITTAYFCMADFAQKNVDVLTRFRRGLYEAATYANAHPADMVPTLVKYTGFDAKTIESMVVTPIAQSPKQMDPQMIQPIIDAAYKYKALPSRFPAKDMIDPNAIA